jgi:hypothetical protein
MRRKLSVAPRQYFYIIYFIVRRFPGQMISTGPEPFSSIKISNAISRSYVHTYLTTRQNEQRKKIVVVRNGRADSSVSISDLRFRPRIGGVYDGCILVHTQTRTRNIYKYRCIAHERVLSVTFRI